MMWRIRFSAPSALQAFACLRPSGSFGFCSGPKPDYLGVPIIISKYSIVYQNQIQIMKAPILLELRIELMVENSGVIQGSTVQARGGKSRAETGLGFEAF